ncbi:DnaJ domain [Trypanosoma vivax]|nr:DnaJ domain [Trypanosoma vivax]
MGSDIFELKGNTALYEVLGVERTAADAEIRRAYYRLAVLYHPDKNPEGDEIFKEISFAHSILSDPEQRKLYDNERLRTHIESQARRYDPMLDPNVELTAEELRQFVERMRKEEEAVEKDRGEFEKEREAEMRRRAEYDAQNPEFRREYELMRARAKEHASRCAYLSEPQPTTAELIQQLAVKQRETLDGSGRCGSNTRVTNTEAGGRSFTSNSVKRSMLNDFRARHSNTTLSSNSSEGRAGSQRARGPLPFEDAKEAKSYPCEVERLIGRYSNFDYRSYVEKEVVDGGGVLEAAILADALGNYDRNR